MSNTEIIIIVVLGIVLVLAFMRFRKTTILTTAASKPNNTIGGQLGRAVPIYGTAVKVASVIEKPVVGVFNTVNNAVTSGLQHIPVIGGIVSEPTKLVGKAVNGILHELGF